MKVIWVALAGFAGLGGGAAIGFGLALLVAKPRNDGTFGMRELLVGLPAGAIVGLALGILLGLRLLR